MSPAYHKDWKQRETAWLCSKVKINKKPSYKHLLSSITNILYLVILMCAKMSIFGPAQQLPEVSTGCLATLAHNPSKPQHVDFTLWDLYWLNKIINELVVFRGARWRIVFPLDRAHEVIN